MMSSSFNYGRAKVVATSRMECAMQIGMEQKIARDYRDKTIAGLNTKLSQLIAERDKIAADSKCDTARLARFNNVIANLQSVLARANKTR